MHFRRLVVFVLGVWLGGSFFMTFVATQNFRSVDRLLESPSAQAAQDIKTLGPARARLFLRHQVSEQNRFYFEVWENVQYILAAAVFATFLFGTHEGKLTLLFSLIPLVLVAVQNLIFSPEIISLGRMLDYIPQVQDTPDRSRFWVFHNAYSMTELVKWALLTIMLGKIVLGRRRRSSREVARDVDVVDKSDYRHING
jgi:hypothetical protein